LNALVRVELLGQLRVVRGERVLTRFRTRMTAGLLAYLAYHGDRGHPRDVLVELFWPGQPKGAGRASLRQALTFLRKQLEPPDAGPGSVIVADTATIALRDGSVATDVDEFERALVASSTKGSRETRAAHLARAVDLYRGELLPGHPDEWIAPERDRLRASFLRAAHQLFELREAGEGDKAELVELARRGTAADRLSEEARRDLMRALALAGEPAEALREFQALVRLLEKELGTVPGPETRALAREIESGKLRTKPEAQGGSPPRPSAVPSDAGERAGLETVLVAHRPGDASSTPVRLSWAHPRDAFARAGELLDGLPGATIAVATGEPGTSLDERAAALALAGHPGQILVSEETAALVRHESAGEGLEALGAFRLTPGAPAKQVFLLRRPGDGRTAFPPLRAIPARPSRLPSPLTRFFGRGSELDELEKLLDGSHRLVTLSGPAGAGKSRLAIETARRLVERRGLGAFFAPLADLSRPEHVPGALLAALGERPDPRAEPLDQLVAALERERALLVLDNAEHILEGLVPIVTALLERIPELLVLATSRIRLGILGERELPLDPLPIPSGEEELAELARCPSVALFLDRAASVRSDFQATAANARAIAALCRRLDGIPLALELAAGRVQLLSPRQLLERLDARFDVLVAQKRHATARHRSLRAALDLSHELLEAPERALFSKLSVFAGNFSVEDAAAVCAEPRASELLVELREASLVARESDAEPPRFRLLETLREYGRERLSPDERRALSRRHADHFLALARTAAPELQGPRVSVWLERLADAFRELEAAIDASLADAGRESVAVEMAAALRSFWLLGSHTTGTRRLSDLLERVLAKASAPSASRASVLDGAAALAFNRGELPRARALFIESVKISRRLGDKARVGRGLSNVGSTYQIEGDLRLARSHYEEALAVAAETGDVDLERRTLRNLTIVIRYEGDFPAARAILERLLTLALERGDAVDVVDTLMDLGTLHRERGDYVEARRFLERALRSSEEHSLEAKRANLLKELGWLDFEDGDRASARARTEESLVLFRKLDEKLASMAAITILATIASAEGRYDEARAQYDDALARSRASNYDAQVSSTLLLAAELSLVVGDRERARKEVAEALAVGLRCRPACLPEALQTLSQIDRADGQLERATTLLGKTLALCETEKFRRHPRSEVAREKLEATLRRKLGDAAFERAAAMGRALSDEAAVELAVEPLEVNPPARPRGPDSG
jgi:predicted ATPase